MRFGDELEQLSGDPRIGVGCVIFPFDFARVLSIGYNGPPAGFPHESMHIGLDTEHGSGMCHAEMNAMTKMDMMSSPPCLMYLSCTPCARCAAQIVNARKIKGVIHNGLYEGDDGMALKILDRGGIPYIERTHVDLVATGNARPNEILRRWYERD